ncbi:MAG: helix-turn-helix transcriptional regulator [Chloroflexaceae bacterium]|nr:helix-turn-helix transcriptional regulator [Chloroflexaceae bacterium]
MAEERLPAEKAHCPVETTLAVIGGRWKVLILRELLGGVQRFGQLHRALNGVTQKMLTQQLRELEADGIIHREVYHQVPPKVEYSLTPLGESLRPILAVMHHWGVKHRQQQSQSCDRETSLFPGENCDRGGGGTKG